MHIFFYILLLITPFTAFSETAINVEFTPPQGWRYAELDPKLTHVRTKVVDPNSSSQLPPAMTLTTEPYNGSLKDYLKLVKSINDIKGDEWKDLGMIRTSAGSASLSQLETKTPWGNVKLMHLILLNENVIYILTASALKEEFPMHYKEFFKSLQSFKLMPKESEKVVSS